MKKIILLILISLVCVSAFADNYYYDEDDGLLENLLFSTLFFLEQKNEYPSELESANFSNPDQLNKYMSVRENATMPVAMNLLLGFGIGSLEQGDFEGGTAALVGDLSSFFLLALAASDNSFMSDDLSTGLILTSCAGLLINRVYQIIRPISYAKAHNEKMQKIIFSSGFLPKDNKLALSLSATIKFG